MGLSVSAVAFHAPQRVGEEAEFPGREHSLHLCLFMPVSCYVCVCLHVPLYFCTRVCGCVCVRVDVLPGGFLSICTSLCFLPQLLRICVTFF